MPAQLYAASAILLASITLVWAEDYTVSRSVEISASPFAAWQGIGDFCDLDDWHPEVASCALTSQDGAVLRRVTLKDGTETLEKLIAVDLSSLNYTYGLVATSLPLTKYTATLSIELGEPSTVTWSSRFSSDDPGMETAVAAFFESGLAEIEARFTQ